MAKKKISQSKPIEMFESAHKLFWKGDYGRAKEAFEKILHDFPEEFALAERVRTFITVCEQRLAGDDFNPRSPQDQFLAGMILLNNGDFKESIAYLKKALKKDENNDAWLFALACAYAQNGQAEEAINTLRKAIAINGDNRFFAVNCSDFNDISKESEFLELVS